MSNTLIPYTKEPISIPAQINLLEEKGMDMDDKKQAIKQLSTIGYYRFTGYAYPFRNKTDNSSFEPGTSFNNVISIYEFDRQLRSLLFNYIERIEIAFRAQIIDKFSLSTQTAFWFCDKQFFDDEEEYNSSLQKLDEIIKESQEDFIKHFKNHYTDAYPAAWISLQTFSFGSLINLFRNFNLEEPKSNISKFFGCDSVPRFISWINTLVYIRNICGHHARLWNRNIKKKPTAFHLGDKNQKRDNTKLYYTVCIIKNLLDNIDPNNSLKEDLLELFIAHDYANKKKKTYIGFPDDWNTNDMVWCS